MLALAGPAGQPKRTFEHYYTRSLAFLILWVGLAPITICHYAVGKAGDIAGRMRPEPVLPIAQTILVGADGNNAVIPTPDGTDAHRPLCWMNQGLEFDFEQPVSPDEMRLTGDHVPIQKVKGVNIWLGHANGIAGQHLARDSGVLDGRQDIPIAAGIQQHAELRGVSRNRQPSETQPTGARDTAQGTGTLRSFRPMVRGKRRVSG